MCLRLRVKNVVVMYQVKEHYIGFYSYQLYSLKMCNTDIMVREVNRYENGRLEYDFLFPTILSDFFGCPITVSANLLQPFITFVGAVENSTHLMDMERLGGIEGEILKLLAKTLNFEIHMRFSGEFSEIGLYYNSTGSFHDLEFRHAQIAIGGLSSTMKYDYLFSRSFAYHTTPYKFVVRGNIFFGPIKQLINPLDKPTWIILLIFFAVSILLIQVINRLKITQIRDFIFGVNNQSPTFYLIITFLGYSMPTQILPKRNFARFLLMSWMILALELRSGYLGKMFDSLRLAKRVPVPKTIAELIALDYTLLDSTYNSFYPRNKTIIWQDRSSLMQHVQSSEARLTGAVILDYWAHYHFKNRSIHSLIPVAETIHSYQCVMYFNKHSFLQDSFNRKLKLFIDSGITSHIAQKHVHSNLKSTNTQTQDHTYT
ncbi:uncharacterized protein LOC135961347 [Calliphora vicina]|uniref:uncharacterized protein LOC135961347 n=1 Tax=Calliphora vicina TaxID=7373 RepID=UPI00325B434B